MPDRPVHKEIPRRAFLAGAVACGVIPAVPVMAHAALPSSEVATVRIQFDEALARNRELTAIAEAALDEAERKACQRLGWSPKRAKEYIDWQGSCTQVQEAWREAKEEVGLESIDKAADESFEAVHASEQLVFGEHAGDPEWLGLQAHVYRHWAKPELWSQPLDALDWEDRTVRVLVDQVLRNREVQA